MAKTERIEFESATLFKELVEKGQLRSLVSVKSSTYPKYCFKNTEKFLMQQRNQTLLSLEI